MQGTFVFFTGTTLLGKKGVEALTVEKDMILEAVFLGSILRVSEREMHTRKFSFVSTKLRHFQPFYPQQNRVFCFGIFIRWYSIIDNPFFVLNRSLHNLVMFWVEFWGSILQHHWQLIERKNMRKLQDNECTLVWQAKFYKWNKSCCYTVAVILLLSWISFSCIMSLWLLSYYL